MSNIGSAPGKIILSGEYAVVFGLQGIAIPSSLKMEATFEDDRSLDKIVIQWEGIKGDDQWNSYLRDILNSIQKFKGKLLQGKLTIKNELPLGKGMGSSTSLVIAVSRCLLGTECRTEALAIEDQVNSDHSGIDFNVIWEDRPMLFKRDEDSKPIDLSENILENAVLIDTGKPNEATTELVEYISLRRSGDSKIAAALEKIGECTRRLRAGEPLPSILPYHHRAQVALGVVPDEVQKLIRKIEESCGAAKVLGAGARTGGGGMVLALHENPSKIEELTVKYQLQSYTLHPTPYALRPTPYTLHPTPYTLHPTPYTLRPNPMITARSTPNIAFIKYWGNRDNDLRLPQANSLSMTLNTPTVEIDIDHNEVLSVKSFELDGSEKELGEKHIQRFRKHLELTKHYLNKLGVQNSIPDDVAITVRSGIPSGIGLASSAAVFSCLARAYQGLILESIDLNDEQTSVIARLGSGSASRSIFGGFSALVTGEGNSIDSSKSIQIADEDHWALHDIVLAPSMHEKKVGSTEGHAIAQTSPHFADRIEAIMTRRQQECIDSIMEKDFEKLQKVTEEDCMDMHHVMETSTPPLKYLNDVTHRIISEITDLRTSQHLPVLYTMDAGPTVHLVCTQEARNAIVDFAHAQADCTVYETKIGQGSHLI